MERIPLMFLKVIRRLIVGTPNNYYPFFLDAIFFKTFCVQIYSFTFSSRESSTWKFSRFTGPNLMALLLA